MQAGENDGSESGGIGQMVRGFFSCFRKIKWNGVLNAEQTQVQSANGFVETGTGHQRDPASQHDGIGNHLSAGSK